MPSASCRAVSSTVAARLPTCRTMAAIVDSGIGPGPLGIAETNPSASAPAARASSASSIDEMQHTFTRGVADRPASNVVRASAATGTTGHADGLCPEVGEQAAQERPVEMVVAQDAATPHTHPTLDEV